ncbi:MAG: acyltransferase domain-containing protein, partial [Candidatus Zixiibacteriota bacterium]
MTDRASDNGPAERRELLRNALAALAKMQREMDALKRAAAEPIAVIGMGCRFPGNVHSPEDYWGLLAGGIDAVRPMPAERWAMARRDLLPAGDVQPPFGGFLDQVDRFDAAFFGISGREAESMDPQQRLLLEVAWETIENAGIDATRLKESRTGVFVGVTTTDYARISMEQGPDKLDAYTATGNALNVTAGRLAFTLGCNGPAMAIDSACSSSLVAIHLACQSLRQKESDMALAGGVNVILALEAFICFNRWGMMAPDGRCKTFDARADGFVRGEGCGLLLLKRLSEAEKNGDPILAVIRGSAVNQDGASSGLTVPNGPAQEAVLRKALESAGLGPEAIGYVEAHGTGTRLGDPIEMEALIRVLGEGRTAENPLRVGSVKTNIGHLESASGVAGVIKVILALQHQAIPPHLHFHTLNPQIRTSGTAVEIPTALVPWTERRIAGVSSFGFSGTNAHVILEANGSREMAAPDTTRPLHLLALSAKTSQALAESARRYSDFLGEQKSGAAGDVCFTANTGRAHFKHRLAVSGDGPAELARKLEAFHSGDAHAVLHAEIHSKRAPGLVFLFTGQGSQYVGMGRRLFETQPTFRRVMTHCDEILRPELARPLLAVLYPDPGREEEARQLLDQTGYAQPALFALEIALAELWRSWGIAPAAVMGHSVGEYVAACAAGVFTLEEGLRLIAARGRLMQALPQGGAMAALFTDEKTALAAIAAHSDRVSLAALNGPANTVISGAAPAVAAIREALQHSGIASVPLNVSHAFHSPLVEPMLDEFERIAAGVRYAAPRIDLVSNLTGEPIGNHEIDAGYWRRHARRPVRFMQSIRSLYALGCRWFVESGPHPVLCGMAAKIEPLPDALRLPSLAKGSDDWARLLESLGRLYVQGAPVDWTGFDRDYRRRRMLLPTYPFQRAHFWVRTPAAHRPLRSNRGMHHPEMNHPLIDRTIRSPHNANAAFETTLDTAALPYLSDHRIFGTTVVPAALFLELGLAAGTLHMQGQACRIEAFNIEAPLLLAQGVPAVLQTTFGPLEEDGATFEIFSLTDEQSSIWQRHASGSIRIEKNVDETEPFVLLGQNQAGELVPQEAYYASLREIGIEYGPAFKGLNEIRHQDGRVTGRLEMPETLEREVSGYFLHPALLDLGFQLLGAALKGKNQGDVYLPIGVELYQVHRPGARPASCRGTLRSAGADGNEIHIGDLRMFDPAGELLAEIQGLRIKRATQHAFQKALVKRHDTDGWLHELQWTALDSLPEPVSENVDGLWLIFTDAAGAGRVLGAALQQHGARIHSVTAGDAYAELEPDHTQVRATEPGDFERLYARVNLQEALRGVVYSWGIGRWGMLNRLATEGGADDGADGWTGLLHLVRILRGSENQRMPLLTIVTSGAVSFGAPAEKVDPAQTLLWGFGRSIAAERPELGCRLVDLDPAGMIEECGAALLREVSCVAREENQVALRSAG